MTKLHLGCGPRVISGWLNLDKYPGEGAHYGDVTDLSGFTDGSIDLIYSEDLFEHLDQREQIQFLREVHRVLADDGWCRIVCPNLIYCMEHDEDTWAWGHKLVPTGAYLAMILLLLGFRGVFNGRDQSECPGMPQDLRPHPPRPDEGHLFVDIQRERSR